MVCLYCRKKIGVLRRITDSEYCCQEHRVAMRSQSARALRNTRDYEPLDDFDRSSTIFVKPIDGLTSSSPQSQSSTTSTATFGLLLVLGVFIATFGVGGANRTAQPTQSAAGFKPFDSLRRAVRSYAAVRLQDDFKSGLNSWVSSSSSGRDWSFKNGYVRPAKLRLWKDSLGLSDYQLEFVSEIENRGIGWAFRARDLQNYYASKIVLTKPGPLPTADLVRYTVIDGIERSRISTPLPMTLRADSLYRVQTTVKGSDFTTLVNGQIVDTWTDHRLRTGGVGFFAESGEIASLRSVQVTDKDTVLGRILSHLGLLRPPVMAGL